MSGVCPPPPNSGFAGVMFFTTPKQNIYNCNHFRPDGSHSQGETFCTSGGILEKLDVHILCNEMSLAVIILFSRLVSAVFNPRRCVDQEIFSSACLTESGPSTLSLHCRFHSTSCMTTDSRPTVERLPLASVPISLQAREPDSGF